MGVSLPASALEIAGLEGLVQVDSVDGLLAAIQPGASVYLAPGVYSLQDATGYGTAAGEYWHWTECYDGYELVIEGVNGLTVFTTGGTELITAPRYANVLHFNNCNTIRVVGLTVGHSPEAGACCGGVVMLENCSGVSLEECVLFGCGVTALLAYDSDTVRVENSTLTDCSYSGAELTRCSDVLFNGCTFSENGVGEEYTGAAVYTCASDYVTVMNCCFRDNALSYLLQADTSTEISLLGCESSGNSYAFFYLNAADVTVVNCSLKDLSFGNAFAAAVNPGRVLDQNGNEISYNALLLMKQVAVQARPARGSAEAELVQGATAQHYYEVSTADAFIEAIGNHRVICVTRDIDLSAAAGYGTAWNEYMYWEQVPDGYQLIIHDVKGLTVTAKQPGVTVLTTPREANVLTFDYCTDITVSGLTVGHTEVPEASCTGYVLAFFDSKELEVEDCCLFGCGTVGLQAWDCKELEVENTEIFDCSVGGLFLFGVQEAEIEHCSIHDCASPALLIDAQCADIEVDGRDYIAGSYDGI